MKNRLLSLLLCLLLLPGLFCVPAQAAGEKLIALTFDDGPGRYTAQLLDGLKARGVKVTFFVVGTGVNSYPDVVRRAYQEGHQIAQHTYNHPNLTNLSAAGVRSQLQNTAALLDSLCGSGSTYCVRPPYGSVNSTVRQNAGAPLILWNVDPLDWKYRNAQRVKNQLVQGASDGAILLAHDIHATTVEGALAAIDSLKAQGYEFVTIQELFRRRGAALENGKLYYSCPPNGTDLGAVPAPDISAAAEGEGYRVTLTAPAGVPVYYTTDGSFVRQGSARYTGPFLVKAPATVRAVGAYNLNGSRSETVERVFAQPQTLPVTLSLQDGLLTLTSATSGAAIRYTLTGEHSAPERLYETPLPLSPGVTLTACAQAPGWLSSAPVSACYTPQENLFTDVFPNAWYFDVVDQVCAAGYLSVDEGYRFHPEDVFTRGQMVTALYRASGETASGEASPFVDVASDAYYADAVLWAREAGITDGYEDGTFRPEASVSRQELAVFLHRFLTEQEAPTLRGDVNLYQDAQTIEDWAKEAVGELTASKLLQGNEDGAFVPLGTTTRAEAAAALERCVGFVETSRLPAPQGETIYNFLSIW